MKTYTPQIEITVIKAAPRTEIAPGVPVISAVYDYSDGFDLAPYLDDNSVVSVTRSTRAASGTFSMRFGDQKHEEALDTIYALVEPMDMVIIRMTHDPVPEDGVIPIIMRGLVNSVTRNEAMAGDKPQRFVTITGMDMMKIMQIYRIAYLWGMEVSDRNLNEWRTIFEYAPDGTVKDLPAAEFVDAVVSNMINMYMQDIASLANPGTLAEVEFSDWTTETSIEGMVSALALSQYSDESLYNIMRTVLDIGVFNEMYMDDTEDNIVLHVRPVPFKTVGAGPAGGEFIQGDAETYLIGSEDIVSQQVSRTDSEVGNYFWVFANRQSLMTNMEQRTVAAFGEQDYVRFDYLNCLRTVFGVRKLEVETVLSADDMTGSDSLHQQPESDEKDVLLDWVTRRRTLLGDLNQDNSVFETGTLKLRGNHEIKCGMYLHLFRGPLQVHWGEVYAHTITHSFSAFNGFVTEVFFDRGTGFIARAQVEESPYIPEIESQAVQ